jgi:hypothetical protein
MEISTGCVVSLFSMFALLFFAVSPQSALNLSALLVCAVTQPSLNTSHSLTLKIVT